MPANRDIRIGGTVVPPGEEVLIRLPTSEFADGTPISIPIVVKNGVKDGPTLFLLGAIHGDEITGTEIIRQANGQVSPKKLAGTLISVPIANAPAFLTRTRGFALEERSPINMHGCFPGDPVGFLTERIAHVLFHEVVLRANYGIDMHTGLAGACCYPFTYILPTDNKHGSLSIRERLARVLGAELIYRLSREAVSRFRSVENFDNTLSEQADARGIPVVLWEMGEGARITEDFVPIGVRGILNFLKELKMLEGTIELPSKPPIEFTALKVARPDKGGLLHLRRKLGQEVKEGEMLAEVSNGYKIVDQVKSPASGRLLRIMTLTTVYPGAEVAWIAC